MAFKFSGSEIMNKNDTGEFAKQTIQEKILANISDVIVIIDKNGVITYKSSNIEKFFGWKPQDLIGKFVWENIHPEDLNSTEVLFTELLKVDGASGSIECRYKSKDGSFKWISFNGTNLLKDQDIKGILGHYYDITEKKVAELALEKSGNLFRTLFNNLASSASLYEVITNKKGVPVDYRFVAINTTYEQYTGLKANQLIGKTLLEVFPRTEKVWTDTLKQVYLTGIPIKEENYAKEVNMYVSLVVYRPQKDMVAIIGTDITEQKQAEKLLKENEEKFRNIVEGLNEAIYRMILPEGNYEYFSPAVNKIFGYSSADFISNPILIKKIIHPDFNDYFKTEFNKLLKGEVSPTYEYKIIDKSGEERWIFQSNKGIFDDKGKIIAIEGLCRNITEKKKAEEALIQSELILKATLESMEEGLLIVNSDGIITHSNTRFKEIFSIPENLLSTKDDQMLIEYVKNQLMDPNAFTRVIEEIYKSDRSTEDLLYFTDNRIIERFSYCLQENSPIKGRVWLFRDVTEKKLYEENLNKFKAAIDYSQDAVYWLNEDGGFDYINEKACKMLGYSYEELIQLKIPDIDPSIQDKFFRMNWERLNANKTLEWNIIESKQKKKDGSLVPVEVSSVFVWMGDKGLLISYAKDISERKRYEETLLKNQKILSGSQRIAQLGSWELDLNNYNLIWNEEAYQIYGYKDKEIEPTLDTFNQLVHPDDREKVKTHLEITLKTKEFRDFECRIIRPDSKVISIVIAGEIIFNEKNDPIKFFGIVQDITERKLVMEEITKSAREKESLMKSMASAFVMWEPVFDTNNKIIDVRFAYINEAYENMTGVKLEKVFGERILDVFPTTELDWFDIFNEIIETKKSKTFDKYFSPTHSYYSCTAYLPWNTRDRICVVFENITERKLAEEQLRKAKEKSEESEYFLQESQRAGYIGSYKMSFETGYWISTDTLDNIFGIDDSYDKNVKGWLDLVHPDDKETMTNYFQNEVIGKRQRFDKEYRIIRKNDYETRWVHGVGKLNEDDDGNLVSMLGTILDITESKLIKDELQRMNAELEDRVKERTVQLEKANNELEAFAYSVSHDLRAPIRHINGFLGLLQKSIDPFDTKAQSFFNKIEISSKNMSVMIDELLKFSRLGRTELHYQEINLTNLINDILERFLPDYEDRSIQWKIRKLPDIKGDPILLTIALENLISNAIKYTSRREIAEIEIGELDTKSDSVAFYIKDNGIGFDMNYKDKLFGVFQRLHNQNEFEGVGIGLANVKQIILKHNGDIQAESKIDEGTTFIITLPKIK